MSGQMNMSRGSTEMTQASYDDTNLCPTCHSFNLVPGKFEVSKLEPERDSIMTGYRLGRLQEIQTRSSCPICQLVSDVLAAWRNEAVKGNPQIQLYWQRGDHIKDLIKAQSRYLSMLVVPSKGQPRSKLIPYYDTQPRRLYARRIEQRLDASLVKSWLRNCEHWHGDVCPPPSRPDPDAITQNGLLVLDCLELCLVDLPPKGRYVTLSYVWGVQPWFKTTKATLPALREHHGLLPYISQLGTTVRDSIDLVQKIGERYLWVDRLCIVQDDAESKPAIIELMTEIYMRAILVIIAASGENADSGLPCLGSSVRLERQRVEKVDDTLSLAVVKSLREELENCKYRKRAWTLQEEFLSRRRLYFLNGEVIFRCAKCEGLETDDETVISSQESRVAYECWPDYIAENTYSPNDPGGAVGIQSGKNMSRESMDSLYADVVAEFTGRELSFETDIMDAFKGVIDFWSRILGTAFLFGIPLSYWDVALQWDSVQPTLRRRTGGFPSWSWCGWVGQVQVQSTRSGLFNQLLAYRRWIVWYMYEPNLEQSWRVPVHGARDPHHDEKSELQTKPTKILPKIPQLPGFIRPLLLRFWTACAKYTITKHEADSDQLSTSISLPLTRGFPHAKILDRNGDLCGSLNVPDSVEIISGHEYEFAFIVGSNHGSKELVDNYDNYHNASVPRQDSLHNFQPGEVPEPVADRLFFNEPITAQPEDYVDPDLEESSFRFYQCWLLVPRNGEEEGIFERGALATLYRGALGRACGAGVEWREVAMA